MSHYSVYVFQDKKSPTIEEMLAPFDENRTLPEPIIQYTKEQAIQHERDRIERFKNGPYAEWLADKEKYEKATTNPRHLKYLKKEFPKELKWTDAQCYRSLAKYYKDDGMIDKDGNLLTKANPNAKWDWWDIGGRWYGDLVTTSGKKVNETKVGLLDLKKTCVPFAFMTTDGYWHEAGRMGWFATVSDEKPSAVWKREYRNYVRKLKKGVKVTIVDCHI